MELELEPRVKPLPYKVKAMSRESPAQKAAHLLDTDLRNHWSTGTNTKEWILLELDEPCLLSHIRIYNKSVLEWEISVGLRYKPETLSKVRPRCEAPRRDITYPTNYTPCRYVRISCLRGNPIALFFIQLIGIPVLCLEPEFQPIANCLLTHISSHKQDASDLYLQLLQDVTSRLARFLPQLESDLNSCAEAPEPTLRFLAMLAGPFYPILHIVSERETARLALNSSDYEVSKTNLSSTALMVSSNFEPRRSRNMSGFIPVPMQLVFRPDVVFSMLRKANKDPNLRQVCKLASGVLMKLVEPGTAKEVSALASDMASSVADETPRNDLSEPISLPDYSTLFGEEFQVSDDFWDPRYLNVLDYAALEEGMLHVLYACASQPLHCRKLAENSSQFWLALPLIQALVPALRPNISSPYQVDENFSSWKQLHVQNALSQIVASSSSVIYCPLLHACAGYLASFSQSHAKAACVLIDLCFGVLSPWMAQVIAKVDLTLELLEDLLGVIQGARLWFSRARAALKYIVLALSGNMDDVMAKYKDAKHRILFLVEMLEPYLDPSFTPLKGISFGNVSTLFNEIQEQSCARALNIIRTAIRKSEVLPALEAEWRRGSVAPSVLLSILDPRMQLPPDIDNRKFSASNVVEQESTSSQPRSGAVSSILNTQETADAKVDIGDINGKLDASEDASLLFAPADLNRMSLMHTPVNTDSKTSDSSHLHASSAANNANQKNMIDQLSEGIGSETYQGIELYNLLADYHQLMNYRDCELKASEFRHLALDLKSQSKVTRESHNVAVNALLLAAECFINPCFMMSLKDVSPESKVHHKFSCMSYGPADIERIFRQKNIDLKLVASIERKRDRRVLEILIEAAELDRRFVTAEGEISGLYIEGDEDVLILNDKDILSADTITLVRQNQALLCNFLMQRLHKGLHEEKHSVHEILMWCLLFLLNSATKLNCSPELVVEIILNFAESLNVQLKSLYYDLKEGDSQLKNLKLLELQRCWILLHRLIIASSGSDERSTLSLTVRNGFRFSNLVPASAWLQKVPVFSSSAFPLVRYFGWMAIARNAKQFLEERLFLVSDLPQLTYLLSIFSDELSLVDNIIEKKDMNKPSEDWSPFQNVNTDITRKLSHQSGLQSFHALYPDISKFFPNLRKEFVAFGETVLEAVGLQVKSLSSSIIPDLMCWLSDLCSLPFVQSDNSRVLIQHKLDYFKGFIAKNAKVVVLYILEAIVVQHMEAMVPEVPRVVQVLVSLCNSSYCDVPFLDSILCLLKPIITYSLNKVSTEEKLFASDSFDNFELLCFSELFDNIKCGDENPGAPIEKLKGQALKIYVLATLFDDLSFKRKTELLQSTLLWAEFASFEEIHLFHDYISAYQVLMENCRSLLIATSRALGILKPSSCADTKMSTIKDVSELSWFLNDMSNLVFTAGDSEKQQEDNGDADVYKKVSVLSIEDAPSFSEPLEALIWKLYPTLEKCWILHPTLSKKLLLSCAECFIYSRCLCLTVHEFSSHLEVVNIPNKSIGDFLDLWRISIEGLPEMILVIQEKHCWEVSSVLLNLLLGMPKYFRLDNVIDDICSAIKNFSNRAPNISWRLQTDKILSSLLARGIHNICLNEVPLSGMFSALLAHPEPEQRYVAIKNLGRLVGQYIDDGRPLLSSATEMLIAPSDLIDSGQEPILSSLVSVMWDHVAFMASADTSLLLRTRATALLINFIPFTERAKMQSFLTAADSILHCLTTLEQPTCNSPLTQLSLALIASVCLYSPLDDILLIPESIWRNIESFGASKNDRYCTSLEKQACEALCGLKNDGDQAKQIQRLKEVLSSSSQKQHCPDFVTTSESILQVIGNVTSAKSYFDFFSKEADEKAMELEEAEMEMELLQKEHPLPNSSFNFQDLRQLPFLSTFVTEDNRLQQIKDEIKSIEKAKIREETVARRQQKVVMMRARQKYLEEAAIREAELVQELDRERANEVEKELERQQLLELERAKTRELQHNLDMEKEKQAQRDLQRELEQVESGVRPSRREFASASHSRSRDGYRESSRDSTEGALRSSPATTNAAVLLPGSRSFSGQVPTILQARERSDEGGSSYEETFDGSKDPGDTGSLGDPDMVSSLEGQPAGFGSGQRHGSRGGKARQVVERRERDSRREGKWERKH